MKIILIPNERSSEKSSRSITLENSRELALNIPIGNYISGGENDGNDDDDDGPKIVPNFPQSASYQSSAPQTTGQFSMP